MIRRLVKALSTALLLAACSDGASPGTDAPLTISWLTWPAAVTAAEHGSIRIVGYYGACGTLVLDVAQSGPSSVSVAATEHFDTDPPPPCPAVIGIFDTVMPLPRLVTPTGPTGSFTIDAPVADPLGGITRRIFGFVELTDQQPDVTPQVGGRALVLADSLGCSWARPDIPNRPNISGPFVLSSNIALGDDAWHGAFISGAFMPALSPRCGQDPLLQLRLLEVDAGP